MVGQLKVHGGRRALAVDFDLESVQGRLVGLGGQALGQAATRPEALARMEPSAAARSAAKA